MIERDVAISTKHGSMPAFVARPPEGGPYPAVILYMDAPGIREELRNMARRIARQGYYCILPDLYYRLGSLRFDTHRRNAEMSIVIHTVRDSIDTAMIMDDTAAMFGFLDGQDDVKQGPTGCVGYCMSGQFVVAAAAHFPDRIAGAASLYGLRIVTDKDDSPHLRLDRVKAELYLAFAEIDTLVPEDILPVLKASLEEAGTTHVMERFAGTHHGFCFIEREAYDRVAAEQAWTRTFELFSRTLASEGPGACGSGARSASVTP
jgi:carboxymethylenebutenolidase